MTYKKVRAYVRIGPPNDPGYFIQAMSAGKATRHFFLQKPGPFVRAIIARAHGVDKDEVSLILN